MATDATLHMVFMSFESTVKKISEIADLPFLFFCCLSSLCPVNRVGKCWICAATTADVFLQPYAWSADAGNALFADGTAILSSRAHDAADG